MNNASPYLELDSTGPKVSAMFNGNEVLLPEGANLAAALLVVGILPFRHTPVSGAPRGPFCMMGACYDCLVELDGVTRQACMLRVTSGMTIEMPAVSIPSAGETRDA